MYVCCQCLIGIINDDDDDDDDDDDGFAMQWLANVNRKDKSLFCYFAIVITGYLSPHMHIWPWARYVISHWLFGHVASCEILRHVAAKVRRATPPAPVMWIVNAVSGQHNDNLRNIHTLTKENYECTTVVSTIGSRRYCATCTGCAFLNAWSSSVWPFLCSAAVTRPHLNTSRETCSGLMTTSLADDYDRRQLTSWLCVAHDSEQSVIVHSLLPHLECGTNLPTASSAVWRWLPSNSVWRPSCSHTRLTSDKLLHLLLPVLEA